MWSYVRESRSMQRPSNAIAGFLLIFSFLGIRNADARSTGYYLQRGDSFKAVKRCEEAQFYYSKAEVKSLQTQDKTYLARIYKGMGDCYDITGKILFAKEFYVKSLSFDGNQPDLALYVADYYYTLRMYPQASRFFSVYYEYFKDGKLKNTTVKDTENIIKYAVSLSASGHPKNRENAQSVIASGKKADVEDTEILRCYDTIDRAALKKPDPYERNKNEAIECFYPLLQKNPGEKNLYLLFIHYYREKNARREWAMRSFYLFGGEERFRWPAVLIHYTIEEYERALVMAEEMEQNNMVRNKADYYLFMASLLYEMGENYRAEQLEKKALKEDTGND